MSTSRARRARRLALTFLLVAVAAGVGPASASAHAVPGIDYRFPLPVWLYGLAAAVAVLASAPAAAVAVRSREPRPSRDLYGHIRPLHLGTVFLVLSTLLILEALVGGFFGSQEFFENPLTIEIWVDFWVGLGIVSALVGNVWDFVSPLNAAGRALERLLARRGIPARPYPERLGLWPAIALLLVWSWMELVWGPAKEPRTLAAIIVAYVVLQLGAMAYFGTEVWLARGELFTVLARTFARFAPLELYVREAAGECRAGRCVDPERPNCPACWRDASPADRGLRLRGFGAGIRREPALGPAGGTFVLALLATVVYDGFSQTNVYARFEAFFLDRSTWLAVHEHLLDTLIMAGIVLAFAAAYLIVVSVVARLEGSTPAEAARRYAPTLIPIAAVYFVSHYFLFLVYAGQFTAGNVADPLGRDWVPDYAGWTGVPGVVVWWIQVVLIVSGHVLAVLEAHRVSLGSRRPARAALVSQAPLVALMVGYTFAGLWTLGQVLAAPNVA